MTTAPTTTPKPRRRWLQFSLRTVMVLVLVLGAGFGWLSHQVDRRGHSGTRFRRSRNWEASFFSSKMHRATRCEPVQYGSESWSGKISL